ncbi:MAG: 2-C-methyl-D-erythritol 4-phosphate cytidylyltransferase [Actinomycetota bacterium]
MNDVTADKPEVWTVVVAAGSGSRFGAPKQFLSLGGRRVIDRSVAAAATHSAGVIVVLPADVDLGYTEAVATPVHVVAGGDTRSDSVRNGLAAVPGEADIVLVHDGARPLASDTVFAGVIAAVAEGADGAVPAIPVVDSIRHRVDGAIDRSPLVAVQTPQGFVAERLRAAHASGADASDDATLVEAVGGAVVVVDGDPANLKITNPLDLQIAELLLGETS